MTITAYPLQAEDVEFGEEVLFTILDDLFNAGVVDGLAVIQNPGGANLSVSVQAGHGYVAVPDGGMRLFINDATTNSGVPGLLNDDHWTATFTAAHGTHPRIDRVVMEVQDNLVDGGGEDRGMFRVVAGTATSGATKDNALGAAAVPDGCRHIAYVQIDAGATTIVDGKILNTTARVKVGSGNAVAEVPDNSITPAKMAALPACMLTKNADQALAAGSTQITAWTTTTNVGGDHDNTANAITIQEDGAYRLTARLAFSAAASTGIVTTINKNGGTLLSSRHVPNAVNEGGPDGLVNLVAGDAITVSAVLSSGTATIEGSKSTLMAQYVGASA